MRNNTPSIWQEELRTALRTWPMLVEYFQAEAPFSTDNNDLLKQWPYPFFIPLTLAKKIKKAGVDSPLWKQFVPDLAQENDLLRQAEGSPDPIGDHEYSQKGQMGNRPY